MRQRSIVGWILFIVFACFCFWFGRHLPSPGKAAVVLGVAAATLGPLWERLGSVARLLWVLLMFGFLLIEMRAIDKDKRESAEELRQDFQNTSTEANQNLRTILREEHDNFASLMHSQQGNFASTMMAFARTEDRRNREFLALLTKEQELFQAQQELTQFLNGKLLPGNDPMPITQCTSIAKPHDVVVSLGTHGNTSLINNFPHTLVAIDMKPVVTVDRTQTGLLVLSVEMRDSENRIIARLDRNGFIVNNRYTLYMLRPDKSSILLENEYGEDILKTRFMNPQSFSITGIIYYKGKSIALDPPNITNLCSGYSDIDISYTFK
jgi:hypothetical protein